MQWLMLQQDTPDDFVIATGVQYSVRQFVEFAAAELGITIEWQGSEEQEVGIIKAIEDDKAPALKVGQKIVAVDPKYYRPTEVETLLGNPAKAKNERGWVPEITLQEMVEEMVQVDYGEARKAAILKDHGYTVSVAKE